MLGKLVIIKQTNHKGNRWLTIGQITAYGKHVSVDGRSTVNYDGSPCTANPMGVTAKLLVFHKWIADGTVKII